MKVYSKVVIDIATGRMDEAEWEEYDGPVAQCYGGLGGDVAGYGGPLGGGPGNIFGPGGLDYYTGDIRNTPYGMMLPYGNLGAPAPAQTPTAPAAPNFYYPTSQETYNSVWGQPHMQQQQNMLGTMGSYPAYEAAIRSQMQNAMKALGRSGLPSSSYADRNISNTLGSLWNQWQWNVLQGWQDIGRQMPVMMNQWYQPYNTMLGYMAS